MEINYKGVLCRLGTYRVNGEDKPTLYYISSPDNETMYKAGFEELHYGLWGKSYRTNIDGRWQNKANF